MFFNFLTNIFNKIINSYINFICFHLKQILKFEFIFFRAFLWKFILFKTEKCNIPDDILSASLSFSLSALTWNVNNINNITSKFKTKKKILTNNEILVKHTSKEWKIFPWLQKIWTSGGRRKSSLKTRTKL